MNLSDSPTASDVVRPPFRCIRISAENAPLTRPPAVGMVTRLVGGGYSCADRQTNKDKNAAEVRRMSARI